MHKQTDNRCMNKRNITGIFVLVLTGLLVLDIIFKGQVYQRLQSFSSGTIDK